MYSITNDKSYFINALLTLMKFEKFNSLQPGLEPGTSK